MKIEDFKIIGNIKYGNFPLVEYMYNEIVVQDTYGMLAAKNKFGESIKTIVDIGGNLGVFSLYARELFPNVRIVSLEAVSDTFISLEENTKNYNIECYNIALGDGGELFFNKCEDHSGANQFRRNKTKSDVSIYSTRLKDIFQRLQIESPYLIKMDIEGSEVFLYEDESCIDILRNCSYFTMEYHRVNLLGYEIDKPTWDEWLKRVFVGFEIDGLGGNDPGATYRITNGQ